MTSFIQYYRSLSLNKKLFWLYLVLIFLEGSMRKWFMPEAQQLWMISREPIVIFIVLNEVSKSNIKSKMALSYMVIAVICAIFTLTIGHGYISVCIWGFRIWFFHFPFIFIMANMLDKRDLRWILKYLIIVFLISTPLYIIQFLSSDTSFWNASIGEALDSGYGVNGAVRPMGFFSHGVGASYFNPIVVSIILAYIFSLKYRLIFKRNITLLLVAAVTVVLITSVSRGFVIQTFLTVFFVSFFLFSVDTFKHIKPIFTFIVIVTIAILVINNTSIGQNLMKPLLNRFENASESEGGVEGIFTNRAIYPYLWFAPPNFTTLNWSLTPFGYGLGLSSNFAAQTLSGEFNFLLGENSSQQITGEMGILFGTIVFFLRIGFMFYILPECIKSLKNQKDVLPLALWPLAFTTYGNGNINLTMTLGLICLTMILLLVALKPDPIPHNRKMQQEPPQPTHKFRPFELNRLTGIRSSGDSK